MPKVKYFDANQLEIDALKNRCFNGAVEFSYFRKGEWTGVEDSIINAATWAAANPHWVISAIAGGAAAVRLLKDAATIVGAGKAAIGWVKEHLVAERRRPNHVCRRVICSSQVPKAHIRKYEEICGEHSVVTIPKAAVGPFTYVVSDKMWAIFSRFGPNDLQGIEGTDQEMISMLRRRFDMEFYKLWLARRTRRQGASS